MKRLLFPVLLALAGCGQSPARSTSLPLGGFAVNNGAGVAKQLKIEIRKGIEIHGEFASIFQTDGSQLAAMPCAFSVLTDFDKWSCKSGGFDLEVGRVVVGPAPRGTLTADGVTYQVTCTAVPPQPNGVDGPVLEYSCEAVPGS